MTSFLMLDISVFQPANRDPPGRIESLKERKTEEERKKKETMLLVTIHRCKGI